MEARVSRLAKLGITVFLVILLSISPDIIAIGQSPSNWDIRVNLITTLETPEAMTLKVYFTIYEDRSGTPILNVDTTSAQVTLSNSSFVAEGQFKKPDLPIYIALVLDSSGSMGGAARQVQEAAKLALNNIPNNSLFAVIQFDEEIKLIQDFTENIPAVSYAIDRYQVSNRGTCLYDAAYSAVESMTKVPAGRRAIVLFTDGKDEKRDGSTCSQHTYQELIELAMKNQVPINTIGLSTKEANINTVELQSMAASTGAFSTIANQDDLAQSFTKITEALKAQWMVETAIYPKRGQNNATLTLNLKDGSILSTEFTVTSNTDYPGPPSPVAVQFSGLLFVPENQTYDVQLSMSSPELVKYIKISIWDTKGGAKAAEYVFNDPVNFNTFNIPTDKLTVGRDYQMRIVAVSKAEDTPFAISRDNSGNPITELEHEFSFDPSAVLPQIEVQSVVQLGNDLQVSVSTTNSQLIGGYDGWLVNESTNTQVPNSNFLSPATSNGSGTIFVPMEKNKVPDGKYTVVIRVLGKNNQVYASTQYPGVVYKATRPSIFQTIAAALLAAPIVFFFIILIILAVVGFLMYNNMREKSMTGTPVMQGQLGAKLNERMKSAPVIPVADEEPIPNLKQPPVRSAASYPTPVSPHPQPPSTPQAASKTVFSDDLSAGETMITSQQALTPALLILRSATDTSIQGKKITLTQFPFMIGRSDCTLTICDASVSRTHAQITYDPTQQAYFITDTKSSNGTRLNGTALAGGQPARLQAGAVVTFGPNVEARFELS